MNEFEFDFNKKDLTASIVKYIGTDAEVCIPEYVEKDNIRYKVTSIGGSAFSYCSSLTSITIPDSVTNIGNGAFAGCFSLTTIKVDPNNKVYDSRDNCNGIIETKTNTLILGCGNTTIPNTVTSIGGRAFFQCFSLTSVTIPDSVTTIGRSAFLQCSSLTSVTIGSSITSLGFWAFAGSSLTSVTIGNNVTSIVDGAFSHCSSLTSITIPDSVTNIGKDAFEYCPSLTTIKVDPNNKVYDSRNDCNGIIETKTNTLVIGCGNTIIPNTVTSIGYYAFSGSSLKSMTIPSGVTSIGDYAFKDCSSFKSIEIPDSVTSFGEGIFLDCPFLTSNKKFGFDFNEKDLTACVTEYVGTEYDACNGVSIPEYVEKDGVRYKVTSIGDSAFNSEIYENCCYITSITIPSGVTNIGEQAFNSCVSLTSITIGAGVTNIGNWAFDDCPSLTTIKVDPDNKEYDSRNNCNAIIDTKSNGIILGCVNTIIPDTVTYIGERAFADCDSLTTITIPENVELICDEAFAGCSNLTNVTLCCDLNLDDLEIDTDTLNKAKTVSDILSEIFYRVFPGCSSLKTITFDNCFYWE